MKKGVVSFAALSFIGLCTAFVLHCESSHKSSGVLRVRDRAIVSLPLVLETLQNVRVLCVGELHDEPSHHRAQLELIQRLHERGRKVAVGLEMFRAQEQDQLNRWVTGEMAEDAFVPVYLRNWNFPWALYRNIFLYCRDHGIPMVGLNIPSAVTRQVGRQGFSSLGKDLRQDLPPVSCNVDKIYQDFIRRAMGVGHGHGVDFEYFCEAQLVWDTAMAWHAVKFLREQPDYMIVILAGSGHAWKRGIPEQVRRQSDLTFRVILPEMPRLDRDRVTLEDTDYLWLDLPLEHTR
jgi:uncharacterized iron-regulated protein